MNNQINKKNKMKQMQVPQSMLVDINYDDQSIPDSVREFRPAVYRDGDSFCVLLGEDPQAGIFGCGETKEQAIKDWDTHFSERVNAHAKDDDLLQYIEDSRRTSKKDVW
jgi:hypothetical protein